MSQNRKQKKVIEREKNLQEEKFREHEGKVLRTLNQIHSNCESIEQQYLKIRYGKSTVMKVFYHYTELWLKWLEFDIKKFEEDRFAGKAISKFSSISYASKATSLEEFWKGLNIFKNCSLMKWTIRFTEKARRKILLWNQTLRDSLMKQLVDFSLGNISPGKNCSVQEEGPCANMVYLTTTIKGTDNCILFAILIEKTPVLRLGKVVQFDFHHYLKVVDIVKKNKDVKHAVQIHKKSIQGDPDRWIEPTRDRTGNFLFPSFVNSVDRDKMNSLYCKPKTISRIYLNLKETSSYHFDQEAQRWVSELDNVEEIISEIDPFQQSIINKLANKQSGQEFIKFIRRIPNFRVKLTEEQENLVKSPGNVLAIGRSGTGKTTCSILRLLSTEILFRYSMHDKSRRFSPEDLDRSTSLHTVFVTASPVLTNEVKQFYAKIGDFIKEKLRERDKRLRAKAESLSKGEDDNETFEDIAEKDVEDEINELQAYKEIDLHAEEFDEFSEEDEIQGPNSLDFMRDEDFPLFATVRKVIFMVDAAIKTPFFLRNKEGNVIGSTSKFQWHNEQKGALLINKEYKISRQTEEIGKVDLESSDSESDLEIEEKTVKENPEKPKTFKTVKKTYLRQPSYEVDFALFSNSFYPRIKGRCSFSAVLVWTEISAYIKGSSSSFKYPGYYLPLITYTSMGRKASMLSYDDKVKIWHFFIEYERWKNKEDAYDMQDVVNYLLNQITFFGYNGVPIHYMMVDEVQDLTPATLYLLLLITDRQLFFSGDTAQTIAKGVGFRFCDLKGLFSESKVDVPNVCQLTVNFRTHNQILGLANSVVALLETLFPLTIDKMAKEVSHYDGPMPSILMSEDEQDLILLVFGRLDHENNREAPCEFGCNQVIIVRNQESKEKLPGLLKHALCLTVYEAKGLEFDDVILYNFFSESEVPAGMWMKIRSCHKNQNVDDHRPRTFDELDNSVPKLETSLQPNNPELSLLCTELKHLYVAVTRAKKRLVIFDDDHSSRKGMEYFWSHMEAAHFATVHKSESGEVFSDAFGSTFAQKTSEADWKAQGLRMFSNKYYEQAQKCFEIAKEKIFAYRAEAYTLANKASQIFVEVEARATELQTHCKKITRQGKKEMKMKKALAFSLYNQAGNLFLIVANDSKTLDQKKVLKEAARCFSSGQDFSKAAEIYKSINLYGQAAETELARGNFEEAGDMFLKKDEYTRAIDAYKHSMNWDKLVKTIYLYKDKMGFEERQKYIQKFVPAAFEELTPKMVPSAEQETNYRKQILLEEKIIPEDSEESNDEEEQSEIVEPKEDFQEKQPHQILKTEENSVHTLESPKDNSSVSLVQDSSSFVLMSSENSFSLLSEKIEDVDPDDEWLQLETGSVVESLDSIINPDGSIVSDFSLLEPDKKSRPNAKLIKTRLDIYAEDTTMRKIIEYISMFSEEVLEYLKSFRSSSSLVSSQVFNQDWELVSLIDLDEISSEMLGLLLDVLEEFGMFRLSLIVCNRYNLYERAGRFILSLAFKYSNLSVLTYASYKLNVREQVQRAAIAFTALHNVFEMINPEYLTTYNSNQLGFEVFQGLFLLGYWKKVVYLLPKPDFFALTWLFSDFNAYARSLCADGEDPLLFQWLPTLQKDHIGLLELQHLVAGLDLILNKPAVSQVPEIYDKTWMILQKINKNQKTLDDMQSVSQTIQGFFKSSEKRSPLDMIKILDAITSWSIYLGHINTQVFFDELWQCSSQVFESFLITTNFLFKHLTELKKVVPESILVRHCILSPAGFRSIPYSKITSHLPLLTHNVIHVSSPLIGSFSKNSIFALDLEGQTYLASNQETVKVFNDWMKSHISNIITTRRRKVMSLEMEINSLGEVWFGDFLFTEKPYSLASHSDCVSLTSPILLNRYLKSKEQLDELKGEEFSDVYFDRFMFEKNAKKAKKLKKKIVSLEKLLEISKFNEKFFFITNLLESTKYSLKTDLELTKTTKLALLTYAQVLINSSEIDEDDSKRDTKIWMAFEMTRISNQLVYFIEMLRSRHRLVFRKGKKVSKLSNVYYNGVGLADLAVFYQFRCFDSLAETALDLVDALQLDDSMKLFFLQLATVSWVFSYSDKVKLPASLIKFNLDSQPVSKTSGKLRLTLLGKLVNFFSNYATAAIQDDVKEDLIKQISDCLSLVLYNSQKDQNVSEIVRKMQKLSSFSIGKSLAFGHNLFKIIEDYPNFKTKILGNKYVISHKEYPDQELEHAWILENKTVASHQKIANTLKKLKKNKKFEFKSLNSKILLVLTDISCNSNSYVLLEVLNKYLADLYHCLYRVALFKSLDLHFLLEQIFSTSKSILTINTCEVTVDQVKENIKALEVWKVHVKPASEKMKEKLRKKWNVRWKSRRIR